MSKEYTVEEIREQFISHVKALVIYWDTVSGMDAPRNNKERLEGLAFSILSTLDGSSASLPSFIVAPLSTKEDKKYFIESNRNYYPINDPTLIKGDIGGSLHDIFSVRKKS